MGEEFLWGVKNGDLPKVKECVEKGVDVNAELLNGRMALHYAADYGQTEVIEYLISKGANVNVLDKHGITPLMAAAWEEHEEAVRLLVSKGADKNVKTPDGKPLVESAETPEMKALLS